jgi:hypothetical protein
MLENFNLSIPEISSQMTRWSQGLIERNFYVEFALEFRVSRNLVLHLTIVFGPVAYQDWNTETPGTERRTPGAKRSAEYKEMVPMLQSTEFLC